MCLRLSLKDCKKRKVVLPINHKVRSVDLSKVLKNDGYVDMWNGWAKKRRGIPVYDAWLDEYETILKSNKDKEILDLGCGNGADTLYLTDRGYNVISCDFSKEALKNVKGNIPRSKTKYLNMLEKFPFKDEQFFVIVADLSLHYFDENNTLKIMNEIKRILKPSGHLLARVAAVENARGLSGMQEVEHNFYFEGDYTKRFFDNEDVERFFEKIGRVEYKKVSMTRDEEEYLKPRMVYQIDVEKV